MFKKKKHKENKKVFFCCFLLLKNSKKRCCSKQTKFLFICFNGSLLLVSRTAQRRVCFKNKKGCRSSSACFKNRSSLLLLVSRTALLFFCLFQEPLAEEPIAEEPIAEEPLKENGSSFSFLNRRTPRRKEEQQGLPLFFCLFQESLFLKNCLFQEPLKEKNRSNKRQVLFQEKEETQCLFQENKGCLFQEPLAVLLFQKTRFCFRKPGFVSEKKKEQVLFSSTRRRTRCSFFNQKKKKTRCCSRKEDNVVNC